MITDYSDNFGGTSSACPLVSGIISLMLTANSDLTSAQVKDILKTTSRKINQTSGTYDQDGHSIYYGYGCIDAEKAVQAALDMRQSQ